MASDFVFKQIGSYSIQAAGKTEARSLATQNMISNIKSIKLTNHASAIKHAITKLRNLELSSTDPFGWGWTIPHLFGTTYVILHEQHLLTVSSCVYLHIDASPRPFYPLGS